MKSKTLLALLLTGVLVWGLGAATPAAPGKRYAILVGISEYLDTGILKLTTPRADAHDMAGTLQNLGWDKVFLMADDLDARSADFPTRSNIEKRVNLLADLGNKNDTVMLFFSGHGVSDGGEDRFLPADADLNRLKETGISIPGMVKAFTSKGITKVVLAVDACRESVTKTKGLSVVGVAGNDGAAGSGVGPALALYATQSGWYSYEDKGGHNSVFTKYLIDGLKGQAALGRGTGKVQDVTAADLSQWLPDAVGNYALDQGIRQKPVAVVAMSNPDQLVLGRGTAVAPIATPIPTATPTPVVAAGTLKVDPVKRSQYLKMVEQAANRMNSGDVDGSRTILDSAVALLPAEAGAYFQYGITYEIKNDPGKAYEWYMKAYAIKPTLRDLNVHIGRMLQWLQLPDDALPFLDQEVKLYPDNVFGGQIYGEVLVWSKGDPVSAKSAIPVLTQVLAVQPDDAYSLEHLGRVYEILKDGANMVKYNQRAIQNYQVWLKDTRQQGSWPNYRDRIARMQKAIDSAGPALAATPAPVPANGAQAISLSRGASAITDPANFDETWAIEHFLTPPPGTGLKYRIFIDGKVKDEFWYVAQSMKRPFVASTNWDPKMIALVANMYRTDEPMGLDHVLKNGQAVMSHVTPGGFDFVFLPSRVTGDDEGTIDWGFGKMPYTATKLASFTNSKGQVFTDCIRISRPLPKHANMNIWFNGFMILAAGYGVVYAEGEKAQFMDEKHFVMEAVETKVFPARVLNGKVVDKVKQKPEDLSVYFQTWFNPFNVIRPDKSGQFQFTFYGDSLPVYFGRMTFRNAGDAASQPPNVVVIGPDTDTSNMILEAVK